MGLIGCWYLRGFLSAVWQTFLSQAALYSARRLVWCWISSSLLMASLSCCARRGFLRPNSCIAMASSDKALPQASSSIHRPYKHRYSLDWAIHIIIHNLIFQIKYTFLMLQIEMQYIYCILYTYITIRGFMNIKIREEIRDLFSNAYFGFFFGLGNVCCFLLEHGGNCL